MTRLPLNPAVLAAAVAQLRNHPDFRLIERLPLPFSDLPDTLPEGARRIAILDCETEGCDPTSDAVIELALMHIAVDQGGHVLGHSKPQSWRQDPCRPLRPEIRALTGLSDADLTGEVLDERTILATLSRCDLIVAHNAKFDVAFTDRQFPATAAMPWACSCFEIPWGEFGFACRKLEHLLADHGGFFQGHRAEADVWALYQLLLQPVQIKPAANEVLLPGTTYLQLLLASSDAGAVRIRAIGLPFEKKEQVKLRGYRWDPMKKVWWKDVPMADYIAEKAAFAEAGWPEPTAVMLTAVNRYRI